MFRKGLNKFCDIVSEVPTVEESIPQAISFSQLENVIEPLYQEAIETEKDFKRKSTYFTERELQLVENDKLLTKLRNEVDQYATNLSTIDKEVNENEKTLQQINLIMDNLERRDVPLSSRSPLTQSGHANMFAMIERLGSQMENAEFKMKEIKDLLVKDNPQFTHEMIESIVNLHLDCLLQTEQKMNDLEAQSEVLAQVFKEAKSNGARMSEL